MKIEVNVDMEDFFERFGDDSLDRYIEEEIKREVLILVKQSDKYQTLVKKQTEDLINKLNIKL